MRVTLDQLQQVQTTTLLDSVYSRIKAASTGGRSYVEVKYLSGQAIGVLKEDGYSIDTYEVNGKITHKIYGW